MRRDDCTLTAQDRKLIRKQADLLLLKAGAYGRFPTPIADIVEAAELEVEQEFIFDEQGIGELYRSLPNEMKIKVDVVKRALGKVEGLLHRAEKKIFIDPVLHKSRQTFLTLHEVGHHDMPWQRRTYTILEDSESELDEGTRDQFEREANCFASDVWFQLDRFTEDARACEFGIGWPIKKLTKRYGTSCYATLRRYVDVCGKAVALLVCEKVPAKVGVLRVRRSCESREFGNAVGTLGIEGELAVGHFFCLNAPLNRFRSPTPWMMERTGQPPVPCLVEAYDSTRQIFFLVYPQSASLLNCRPCACM